MPIEIKEMSIKINVREESAPKQGRNENSEDMIIQECMDQVAKMLNNKDER